MHLLQSGVALAVIALWLGHESPQTTHCYVEADLAMKDAFRKMRRFLMSIKGLTEDEAIALMSVAVDFGVTQVVDGNWGVHAIISKRVFADSRA